MDISALTGGEALSDDERKIYERITGSEITKIIAHSIGDHIRSGKNFIFHNMVDDMFTSALAMGMVLGREDGFTEATAEEKTDAESEEIVRLCHSKKMIKMGGRMAAVYARVMEMLLEIDGIVSETENETIAPMAKAVREGKVKPSHLLTDLLAVSAIFGCIFKNIPRLAEQILEKEYESEQDDTNNIEDLLGRESDPGIPNN